jgi:hypothetical protein
MPVPFTQLASSCEDLWELIRQHQDKLKLQPPKDPVCGPVSLYVEGAQEGACPG